MKILAILVVIGFLASCAANNNWDGMTSAEVAAWKAMNIDEDDAQRYQRNGMSAYDVERWMDQGIVTQDDIIAWKKSRFDAIEAGLWRARNFTLDEAVAWAKENFSAIEAQEWREKGFDLMQAIRERSRGLEPEG